MVYRQETMRFLGFPLMRYIDMNAAEAVLRAIDITDRSVPLDIVLHKPGGRRCVSVAGVLTGSVANGSGLCLRTGPRALHAR
jgi:Serine dehydrogenase proteinase